MNRLAGDSVRQQRSCLQWTHSRGKDTVVFIHRIPCAIPQDPTWRQSPPGSSNLPGPVEQSHRVTAGRAGMVSTRGMWVEHYTREQRAWAASGNVMLPEPRSDSHASMGRARHGPCDGAGTRSSP